jgi:hypothetical protein
MIEGFDDKLSSYFPINHTLWYSIMGKKYFWGICGKFRPKTGFLVAVVQALRQRVQLWVWN